MRYFRNYNLLFWAVLTAFVLLAATSILSATVPNQNPPALVINELMASNGAGLTDEDGDFSDWIEIHNTSKQPVNLSGWHLTDDMAEPQKWAFPDLTLPGGGYLIVFASGKNRANPETGLHTNFRLSKAGEFLGLYNVLDARFVDAISPQFPPQLKDTAYGNGQTQTEKRYFSNPSPGQANSIATASNAIAAPVQFHPTRGFYNAPFQVKLQSNTPEATIRYTLDGTEPTASNGQTYSRPIPVNHTTILRATAIKKDFLPAPVATHSYLFMDNIINQPANPPGWPATWGVYLDYRPYLPEKGAPVAADYQMDRRITKDPAYSQLLKKGLSTIPSLSLVTAPENFDIYVQALERGEAWERPVSIEWIDPVRPEMEFQANAGIRMQGVSARWEFMPKKSFRLFFKGKYGPSKLKAPIFPNSPVDEFNTLVLRGGANRSYAGYPDAVDYTQVTYTRDEWMRASQIEMSGVGSHGRFVQLYLNGLYWGLYNLVERPDVEFAASYYGGNPADWFAIKHGGAILNPEEVANGAEPKIKIGEEISGSNHRYQAMLRLLEAGNLDDAENYKAIRQYVDTAQFIDYIILNLYAGNNDWGDNNWYIAIQNNPPGPLRYFVWDAEVTWNEGARLYLGKSTPHHKMRVLFLELMKNPDFRMEFADRVYKNLFNNGPLSDENSRARWIRINDALDPAIVGESARWGDVRYTDTPVDYDDWQRAVDGVLAQMEGNAGKLVNLLRQESYYPAIDPPLFSQPGGPVRPGFKLTITAPEGAIYFTTNGSDPREAVSGAIGAHAKKYQAAVPITETTPIKSRVLLGEVWSSLHEEVFTVSEGAAHLQITKLMYNPIGGSNLEFLEITNTGEAPFDLAGMSFDGISYVFPPTTSLLPPGEKITLARNFKAFAAQFPDTPVDGLFEGQLSNQGETISLLDAGGNVVTSVTYDDENGWPISADGRGDLLELVNLAGDPNDPKNWRAKND